MPVGLTTHWCPPRMVVQVYKKCKGVGGGGAAHLPAHVLEVYGPVAFATHAPIALQPKRTGGVLAQRAPQNAVASPVLHGTLSFWYGSVHSAQAGRQSIFHLALSRTSAQLLLRAFMHCWSAQNPCCAWAVHASVFEVLTLAHSKHLAALCNRGTAQRRIRS